MPPNKKNPSPFFSFSNPSFLLLGIGGSVCFILLLIFVFVYGVDKDITEEDTQALKTMMTQAGYSENIISKNRNFSEEIKDIRHIQDAVLTASPQLLKIPLGQTREPADLLAIGHGQCSDRARSIEKGLTLAGFETRFASIFSRHKEFTPPATLAIDSGYDLRSHAVIEVLTEKGWLFVDTNARWISLDENGNPVSLKELQEKENKTGLKWDKQNVGDLYWIFKGPFSVTYGIYSRHGQFYPPYTPYVPDINWGEFIIENLKR